MNDPELRRDAEVIVTAVIVKFTCRRCGEWFSGRYESAHLGWAAHMKYAHDEEIAWASALQQEENP